METFVAIVIIVAILWLYISHKIKENEEEEARRQRLSEERYLQKEYPDGFNYYKHRIDECIVKTAYASIYSSAKEYRSTDEMVSLKSEIIKKQEQIDSARKEAAETDDWFVKEQEKFSAAGISAAKAHLPSWGRYSYSIPWEKRDSNGKRTKCDQLVWQIFVDSLCLDQDLDYTLLPVCKANFDNLPKFKNKTRHWMPNVYTGINKFLEELAKQYHIGILFNISIYDWNKDALMYHYENISREIPNTQMLDAELTANPIATILDEILIPQNVKFLVIIDCFTENSVLIKKCKNIFKQDNHPCIIYLSLLKSFDRDEMQKWIDEKRKEYEAEERAKKIAEEERQRKERVQREKEERKRNALPSLKRCVSSWETLAFNIPYNFLLHYYPTTCDFEATEDEWDDRWLVWNFKNTPGKTSEEEHEEALDEVIPRLTSLLENTFGNYLDLLTLVCIPASSEANNNARFEDFSERLTNETDMDNAFDHIQVVKDATPKHLGGTGAPILHFDEDYFKGRYILLFDDVITKGNSMLLFKRKLEALGATVIAGMSVGKTTHERQNQSFLQI